MPYKYKEDERVAKREYMRRPEVKERSRAYFSSPKRKEATKNLHLMRTYGITLELYNVLFQKQLGCCAICKKHQSNLNRALDVDHDHKTNKVRGLLCGTCNTHLGIFESKFEQFSMYLKGEN